MLRVGIIGAGRTNEGTGPYVMALLRRYGADVTAIVNARFETASRISEDINRSLGTRTVAYHNVDEMLTCGRVDAVAICSPAQYHLGHVYQALDARLHVFCEKPIRSAQSGLSLPPLERLFDKFDAESLVLYENLQWVYTLQFLVRLYGLVRPLRPRRLWAEFSPSSRGAQMFLDSVSHPVSLAVAIGATKDPFGVEVRELNRGARVEVRFQAETVHGTQLEAGFRLDHKSDQPRPAAYELDGARIERIVTLPSYTMYFQGRGARRCYADPLGMSVRTFVRQVSQPRRHAALRRSLSTRTAHFSDVLWKTVSARMGLEYAQYRS